MASDSPASKLPRLVAFDLDATLWSPEMYELDPPFALRRRRAGSSSQAADEHATGAGRRSKKRAWRGGRCNEDVEFVASDDDACDDDDVCVCDAAGVEVKLYADAHAILHELATAPRWGKAAASSSSSSSTDPPVIVAYVSRTMHPASAAACMKLMRIRSGDAAQKRKMTMLDIVDQSQVYPGIKTAHFAALQESTGVAYADMLFFDNERRNVRDVSARGVTSIYTPEGMTKAYWQDGLRRFAENDHGS
jgi:magnesium-dependent phosphatase 1